MGEGPSHRCAPTVSFAVTWCMYALVIPRPPWSVGRQQAQPQPSSIGVKSFAYELFRRFNVPADTIALPNRWTLLETGAACLGRSNSLPSGLATHNQTYLHQEPLPLLCLRGIPRSPGELGFGRSHAEYGLTYHAHDISGLVFWKKPGAGIDPCS